MNMMKEFWGRTNILIHLNEIYKKKKKTETAELSFFRQRHNFNELQTSNKKKKKEKKEAIEKNKGIDWIKKSTFTENNSA